MNIKNVNNHSNEFINTLIDFYGKTGDPNNALNIFNKISRNEKEDIVSIRAMMNAYNHNEEYHKSISLYQKYNNNDNIKHNDVSNILFIKACINIAD